MARATKLAYLVSHPIQYQAPLLRHIAAQPDIDLTVFFGSNFSARGYRDKGFGVEVAWDVPLLEGYRHEFLPTLRDTGDVGVLAPVNRRMFDRFRRGPDGDGFDALWVHGYATANALQGMVAAKAASLPVLLRAESWLKDRARSSSKLLLKRAFFAALRPMVNAVLPIGTRNAEYWTHYLGDGVPQFLMPYAVDNGYFQTRSAEAAQGRSGLRAELDLDATRPVILFASKLQARKRCMDLLMAYQRLPTALEQARPYLVIVGDGEERERLEAYAREHGLGDVRFCGFRNQSELPRFFDVATVFVLPSEHEPWGLIVNEAMSAGRPVIVSDDVGAQPDLITDGVEGYVFPTGDVDALANALVRLLAVPDYARVMGDNALTRVSAWNFDADVCGLRAALASVTAGARS